MKPTLTAVFCLVACVAVWCNAAALEVDQSGHADFGGLQFKILSPDEKQTIGSTRFTVSRNDSTEEIKGETRYLDGERDNETELLHLGHGNATPELDSYQHSFFYADGTLHMIDTLDRQSGIASCTSYSAGAVKVRKSQVDIPADSFAGASGLMMVVGGLRQGRREIRFHAFACAPGPEIFAVKTSVPDRAARWPLYPGDLFRLDMQPDFGPLNYLIAPFIPTTDAWFDPHDNWSYVGGEFDRYFRGPHVLTVRVAPAD